MDFVTALLKLIAAILGLDWGAIVTWFQKVDYTLLRDDHSIELFFSKKMLIDTRTSVLKGRGKRPKPIQVKDYRIVDAATIVPPKQCSQNAATPVQVVSVTDSEQICYSEHVLSKGKTQERAITICYQDYARVEDRSLKPGGSSDPGGPLFFFQIHKPTSEFIVSIAFKEKQCSGASLERAISKGEFYEQTDFKPDVTPDAISFRLTAVEVGDRFRLSSWHLP